MRGNIGPDAGQLGPDLAISACRGGRIAASRRFIMTLVKVCGLNTAYNSGGPAARISRQIRGGSAAMIPRRLVVIRISCTNKPSQRFKIAVGGYTLRHCRNLQRDSCTFALQPADAP